MALRLDVDCQNQVSHFSHRGGRWTCAGHGPLKRGMKKFTAFFGIGRAARISADDSLQRLSGNRLFEQYWG